MSKDEFIFTLIIGIIALIYIYTTLFKKSSCGGSCGCSSGKNKESSKHYKTEKKGK